ncbi:hypothetical protein DPMN_178977 [Dreissena polymorpha]|uniref:Uncharacterized protein n=1 Tax=Dreissena polymorpha TaxID=45954 RepID=A0A9D4IKC8_DREPO|nr:hypothetical protein DPMN_178977 [Dreissena polymorpha]
MPMDGTSTAEVRIKTEQAVDTQLHQLHHQAQAQQVPNNFYPNVRLRYMDTSRGRRTGAERRIQCQVSTKTAPHLLH